MGNFTLGRVQNGSKWHMCLLVTTFGGIHSESVAVIIFLCVLGVFFSTLHESEEQGCHSNSSWTRRTANTCISGAVAFTLISLNLSLSFQKINTFAHIYDMHLSHQRSLCTLHPIFFFWRHQQKARTWTKQTLSSECAFYFESRVFFLPLPLILIYFSHFRCLPNSG